MPLDIILIADAGIDTFSGSNPLRLQLDGHTATVQTVANYLENHGRTIPPIAGDGIASWESAPKLNGVYLFSYLQRQGFSVALINNFQKERERFSELSELAPKVIAISTTFLVHRKAILELVTLIRGLCPSATIVVGGPFVSTSWRILQKGGKQPYDVPEIARDFLFHASNGDHTDLYIVSDLGEELLAEATRRVLAGGDLHSLPNCAYPQNGHYVFTERVDDIGGYEETPIDWDRLPDDFFASGVVPMRASIGCPYRCSFCSFNKDPRLTFAKPLEQLIEELHAVKRRGARYVWFVDDNFRLGKTDLEVTCRRFIEEKLSLQWMSFIRAEVLREVDPHLLRQAGCREVQLGIESADTGVLASMCKKSDPLLNETIIGRLLKAGINCSCYFIFGFPGETAASIQETVDFIKRLEEIDGEGVFSWSIYPFLLAPCSPIFEMPARAVYALSGYMQTWQHRTMNSDEVKLHLKKAFRAFDRSSPIYRGDNLDQLASLGEIKAKRFMAIRHQLEKMALAGKLDKQLLIEAFGEIFTSD